MFFYRDPKFYAMIAIEVLYMRQRNNRLRPVAVLMLVVTLLTAGGCARLEKYSYEFTGVFDTMIQIVGYADNRHAFEAMAQEGQERFEELHRLFDIYHDYPGLNNIKTINDNAGLKAVEVEQEIIDLLLLSAEWYNRTGGAVNVAMGPVLSIWHDYREEGLADPGRARIPELALLQEAAAKSDISKVIIDRENRTVFLSEQGMKLDVGAVAKGYATELVAQDLISKGYDSFAISGGGNVRVVGAPRDGKRTKWSIGIQDPNGNALIPDRDLLDTAYVADTSVVTSGDYQRYYVVDDMRVHHLIDPVTLMPADHYRAVTVITKDSGFADFLSSTLFLLPYEKSRSLAESLEGVEALWVMPDGEVRATDGMKETLKSYGGNAGK